MTADLDIWRTANLLIQQYGDEAKIIVAMRVDALLNHGDMEGRQLWLRILRAIEELQRIERPAGDPLH